MVNQPIEPLIKSQEYDELAKRIMAQTNKTLCTDIYDAEVAYCQKILAAAEISAAEINSLLTGDAALLEAFCIQLIKAERSLELGQDYNEHEPEDQEEENEQYVGHSPTFLLTFSVMYMLLRDRRKEFGKYLKAIRQPKAKEYQRRVEAIFDTL